jgi:hypothetical protein
MNINELREYQLEFEKNRNNFRNEFKSIDEMRKKFVKDFPINRIKSLSPDEYVIGKKLPSFCHRIENELNAWGNIHGAPAIKFGVYYGNRSSIDSKKDYRYANRFGDSFESCFMEVKKDIYDLLANHNNLDILRENKLSPMFKGKILSVYYPNDYLNIFASSHLDYFINILGLLNTSIYESDKQICLLDFKNADEIMKHWSVYEFSRFLYHSFGRPNDEIDDKILPMELKEYKLEDFPPIEKVTGEFIELNYSYINEQSKQKHSQNSEQSDYESNSKKAKRIGDRGEQIVIKVEREYLVNNGKENLANKVESIKNDRKGYDILSYDLNGDEKLIEVKSTLGDIGNSVIKITSNEVEVAKQSNNYFIYVVYNTGTTNPKIWKINSDTFIKEENLIPVVYRIKFVTKTIMN